MLTGAYNTGGPPIVIYADCCKWNTQQFKSNLQGFFLVGSILVVISHAIEKNFTLDVCKLFILVLPTLLLALPTGIFLSRYINPFAFRKTILILLAMMGVRLIFVQ